LTVEAIEFDDYWREYARAIQEEGNKK